MSLTPSTRLGSYEIVSQLGSGGMGEIYKAKDLKLGRDVTIKVLWEDLAADSERFRRVEQEARAASSLNHPTIVTIHDIAFAHQEASQALHPDCAWSRQGAPAGIVHRDLIAYPSATQALESIARCIVRCPVSLQRRDYHPDSQYVVYHPKSKNGRAELLDPQALGRGGVAIAAVFTWGPSSR